MNKILEKFRQESIDQLKSLKPEDVVSTEDFTVNKNLTLVARPDNRLIEVIKKIIKDLRKIEPKQYYYPLEQLHLTILGNIKTGKNSEEIIDSIRRIISGKELIFDFLGVASNQYSSSITGYPKFPIHELREELRNEFGVAGDDYKKHLVSYEYMGWINYLRYTKKPSEKFLDKLREMKDLEMGEFRASKIQLFNHESKVLEATKSRLMFEFAI